jgi:hypothetical protein
MFILMSGMLNVYAIVILFTAIEPPPPSVCIPIYPPLSAIVYVIPLATPFTPKVATPPLVIDIVIANHEFCVHV